MKTKRRRTLQRIFAKPTPSYIRWTEIEAMLRVAGVEISERAGSRIGLRKDGERISVHMPYPQPEVGRATVRAIAGFLKEVRVLP